MSTSPPAPEGAGRPRPIGRGSRYQPRHRARRSRPLAPLIVLIIGVGLLVTGLAAMSFAKSDKAIAPPPTRAAAAPTKPETSTTRSTTSTSTPPTTPNTPAPLLPSTTAPTTAPPPTPPPPPPTQPPAVFSPAQVEIPAIKVAATVDPMGLEPDGTLEVPTDFARVGWFSGGPKPGEPGAAVLEGHVDSKKGPAVFYALRKLQAGDEVRVRGSDGFVRVFVVDRLASYAKDAFPNLDVYAPTESPELRVITCTGSFDRAKRSYRDNLVVYANLKV